MREEPVEGRRLEEAVATVRSVEARRPEVALILGSGLGALADELEGATRLPARDIPGYPHSSVAGHDGELVIGHLEGRTVAVVRGRVHCYEGYSTHVASFPVRLVHALGARRLLVTNAAGGIHRDLEPGSLMFITDHLNLTYRRASAMRPAGQGMRVETYSGGASPYDRAWLEQAESLAVALGIPTRRGVYVWTMGPSYETRAEIRFFQRIGADAVGMSTVPEVDEATRLGMRVLGVSTITNRAAGLDHRPLSHDDVLAVGRQVQGQLRRLVRAVVRSMV